MRSTILALGAILLASTAIGCATQQTASKNSAPALDTDDPSAPAAIKADTTPIRSDSATLVVYGMGCPLCANNVDLQLKQIKGVSDVAIDLGTGEIKIEFAGDTRPSRAVLAQAIVDSGFTLVSINTP